LPAKENKRAGGRAYSVREVSRAEYQFCFVHQSATAIAVHETRIWLYTRRNYKVCLPMNMIYL